MIYTSSPPLATSYQKVPRKCIVLYRHSGLTSGGGGVWITPRTKASVDVVGVGAEVDAGAGWVGAAAGAEAVALVSGTGTADDLGPRGTLANASMVVFPLLSCMSSWSCSTAV